jgi:hypothetical protein
MIVASFSARPDPASNGRFRGPGPIVRTGPIQLKRKESATSIEPIDRFLGILLAITRWLSVPGDLRWGA